MATAGFKISLGNGKVEPSFAFSPVNSSLNNLNYVPIKQIDSDMRDFLNIGNSLNNKPISSTKNSLSTTNSVGSKSSSNGSSLADWLVPVVSSASGIISNAINRSVASDNLEREKENLSYQKALQQEIFNREDTAFQRATADLEKAGLSKTLALPSGADSGAVVSTNAPSDSYEYSQVLSNALLDSFNAFRNTSANIELMNAQANLLNQQAINVGLQNEYDSKFTEAERSANLTYKIAQTSYITDIEMQKGRQEIENLVSSHDLTEVNIKKVLSDIGVNDKYIDKLVSDTQENYSKVLLNNALTDTEKQRVIGLGYLATLYDLQGQTESFKLGAMQSNKENYYDILGIPTNFSGSPIYNSEGSSIGIRIAGTGLNYSSSQRVAVTLENLDDITDLKNAINRLYNAYSSGNFKEVGNILDSLSNY